MSTWSAEDGNWYVQGQFWDSEGKRLVPVMLERVRDDEDPSARLDYWRSQINRDGSKAYQVVRIVEIQVNLVQPKGWAERCLDHRPIVFDCPEDSKIRWGCRCGTALGQHSYGKDTIAIDLSAHVPDRGQVTREQARTMALREHDRHVVHVNENLICSRCNERDHTAAYCEVPE